MIFFAVPLGILAFIYFVKRFGWGGERLPDPEPDLIIEVIRVEDDKPEVSDR